ncbi:MAG: hypothetical protein AAB426_13175 [Myxococcota bacterium]
MTPANVVQRAKILGVASLTLGLVLACSARAEDKPATAPYELATGVVPSPLAAGGEGRVRLTITPHAPWVLKMVTPLKITLTPSTALTLAKTELGKDDVEDAISAAKTFGTAVKASSAGAHKVDAALSFFLCTDEICQRYETSATIAVPAK